MKEKSGPAKRTAGGHCRRRFLKKATVVAGSAVFARSLWAAATDAQAVTREMVRQAEWVAGLTLTDEERELMREELNDSLADAKFLRGVPLDNAVPPAILFAPIVPPPSTPTQLPPSTPAAGTSPAPVPASPGPAPSSRPASDEDLAFLSAGELSDLLAARKVSSMELTRVYLERIRRFDPLLECAVTVTEELALAQAAEADRERAAGRVRGPLHGIPWGAKDLVAVPGYRTTWGSVPYRGQVRPETATVYAKLAAAGAVLVAKTSVGELAWGDVWFGGTTRNPWKAGQGSSGSSAGSAAGTAAGLFGFAIGTETLGSIVSPCSRCGVTGLRPTFGRVSRHGVMALAWTMDKVGAIARSAADCALVLGAIHGKDPLDPFSADSPFAWPPSRPVKGLRVGFVASLFEEEPGKKAKDEAEKAAAVAARGNDLAVLDVLRSIGVSLVPFALPSTLPVRPLGEILTAEASACFDDLTRSGGTKDMVRQVAQAWPNVLRRGELIPAVTYLRAQRVRSLLMREMEKSLGTLDAYVVPSFGGDHLLLSNLTGHPAVVVPNGVRPADGTPTSVTFMGRLWGEAEALSLAAAYQQATGWHRRRPPLALPAG